MPRRHLRAAAVLGTIVTASNAAADRRAFTHTYEYMTMPERQTELEIYTEQGRSTFDGDAIQRFKLQLEIEHGITDRWDVSLYHVFEQQTGPTALDVQDFHLAEMKLRSRYRFSERGEWPIDLALYAEGVKVFGESIYEAEGKVIVARDFGLLTVAAQPIAAVEFGGDVDEPEVELGWAAGATYEIVPAWKAGAETWGAYHEDELTAWAGPAASWAPAESLWVTLTAGFGLTEETDAFNARAILGLHL